MLELVGDILNWLAAGVVFPLMLLPLAVLAFGDKRQSALGWFAVTALLVAAGILFAFLAPRMGVSLSINQLAIFTGELIALALLIYLSGGAAKTVRFLSPLFSFITKQTCRAVMWLVLLMALVQFSVVFLRYVFGVNYIYMQESITYMHGAVFLIAAGYTLLTNDHVRVDIFFREAPPKRKALVDFLGTYFLLFPMCLLLLWAASPYVANSWAVGEGSAESSGIQGVFLIKSLIPAFAILLSMAGFNIAASAADELRGHN